MKILEFDLILLQEIYPEDKKTQIWFQEGRH